MGYCRLPRLLCPLKAATCKDRNFAVYIRNLVRLDLSIPSIGRVVEFHELLPRPQKCRIFGVQGCLSYNMNYHQMSQV